MKKYSDHTASVQTFDGIPVTIPNKTDEVVTGSPHWYVSYNNRDRSIYGADTTALVLGQMEYFLILNGDHRQQFQEAIDRDVQGRSSRLDRCLQYVRANKDNLSKFSNAII